ncbi:hypothetical protein SAMN05216360_101544 [Methylobacterium phyllostachyos]|uniref:Uncharacterized protein n=1 Tax=Methylobacterium phyllostachyos TaxID=582672 RepID=A0A1G9S971_9HYPH|nr:hypothetical protein [Methylobacterium phyllostachyos]SDM31942.1 hypothetical protein SAMN05216360_101544 [Methylobacterium phyllostachyos]
MTTASTPRLPPVARGACRAIHAAPPALPESPPVPPADAPVEEVLANQAVALVKAVEETEPVLMKAARDAARLRAQEEAVAGASETYNRPRTLTHLGYGPEPTSLDERAHVARCRAAGFSGAAARLRPFLGMDHPRAGEARDLHDKLVAAEAEWKARAERERHPSRG